MRTVILGEHRKKAHLIRECLVARGHRVTHFPSLAEMQDHWERRGQVMFILVDPEREHLDFVRELRSSGAGVVTMCVAVIAPERVALMPELVKAGVDEAILESLADRHRLDARLAFVEEAAKTKLERWEAERRAIRREMQHAVITRLAQTAVEETNPSRLFAEASETIVALAEVDASLLMAVDEPSGSLTLEAYHGWGEAPDIAPSCDGFMRCLNENRVLLTGGNGQQTELAPSNVGGGTVRSGVCVPIVSDGAPMGVLAAYSFGAERAQEDEVEFLQMVANFLASALRRKKAEEALRESETRAKTILNTTVDAIITIDASGTIESFNQAAEKIFGYAAEEVVGENVKVLMPSPYRQEHDEYLANYHRTGKRKIIGIGREVVGRRKDGSTFPMYLAVSEMEVGEERLYTGIVRDVTEQRRLEREILRVTEHERHRIGQDLHDGLGQMLTGIGLISQSLSAELKNEGHPAANSAEEITSLIKEADQHARMLSRSLVPVEFDEKGLVHALERLSRQAERLFGISCALESQGIPDLEDITTEVHLYRIAQEAVSNAVRHGQASQVKIMLVAGEERLRLRIQDNGEGFSEDWQETEGLGVRTMNFRAKLIGGILDIQSSDRGTTVTASVPYVAPA